MRRREYRVYPCSVLLHNLPEEWFSKRLWKRIWYPNRPKMYWWTLQVLPCGIQSACWSYLLFITLKSRDFKKTILLLHVLLGWWVAVIKYPSILISSWVCHAALALIMCSFFLLYTYHLIVNHGLGQIKDVVSLMFIVLIEFFDERIFGWAQVQKAELLCSLLRVRRRL